MRKPLRSSAKAPKPHAPARRAAAKKTAPKTSLNGKPLELSPDEVTHLEHLTRRYEESERAWQRMTALPDGDETWTSVEEHLFARSSDDPERRWKYFSK